jgi:hypothetical protein
LAWLFAPTVFLSVQYHFTAFIFMASNVEDFVKRLTRTGRQFTFVFTEDFFSITGKSGVDTARFLEVRNTIKNVKHRKGLNAEMRQREGTVMFDVDVAVVSKGFSSFMTTFDDLTSGPFSDSAIIYGMGGDMVNAQKAKFQVDSFFSEQADHLTSTKQIIDNIRKRKIILVVESPADLKRPSLEPFMKLRSQLTKILISSIKGPVVDCQISKIYQEGNSSSLSSLLNMFCVNYG